MKGVISGYAWLLMLYGLFFGSFGMIAAMSMDSMDRHFQPDLFSWYVFTASAGFMTAVAGGLLARFDLRRHKPSMGRLETVVLAIGFVPLSGFILFLAWALADSGENEPGVCLTGLAGWAMLVAGIWLFIIGVTKGGKEKGSVLAPRSPD